ncbi:MAG: hypothetical protein V3S30_05995 [Thermoanaerobaculia bacterium]
MLKDYLGVRLLITPAELDSGCAQAKLQEPYSTVYKRMTMRYLY